MDLHGALMQIGIRLESNLRQFAEATHLRIARGARTAAERIAVRSKILLRQDVLKGGLGQRVANSWRADIYPRSASTPTMAPAVIVYTRAPKIIKAFGDGAVIRHHDGLYLAIPTENTPRRGRRLATPVEVEVLFNQDLIFIRGKGGQMLAFVDAVKARSGRGFRRATNARTGKQSRRAELVLMFVMVRQVHLRKRLDWRRIFADLQQEWPKVFAQEIARSLEAGVN